MIYFTKEKLRYNNTGFSLVLMVFVFKIRYHSNKNTGINRQQPRIFEIVTISENLGHSFTVS